MAESQKSYSLKKVFASCSKFVSRRTTKKSGEEEVKETKNDPRRATLGLKGLLNFGNTCFMNSAIQCLANTIFVLELVLYNAYFRDINYRNSIMKGTLIKEFSGVIKQIWSAQMENNVVNIAALKAEMEKFAPSFMGYCQQDAQEFLRYFLQGLHDDINRAKKKTTPFLETSDATSDRDKAYIAWSQYLNMNRSKIVDIFVGQLKSVLKCCKCHHRSVTFEVFWDLSLAIPQKTGTITLSDCLELLTKKEILTVNCDKCKKQRDCHRRYTIVRLPKVLMVHLKRFGPTETSVRRKLSYNIDFPIDGWNLKKFTDGTIPCIYNLYAVCNHIGSTYSGHYTAYCKHPFTGEWNKYDDSLVTPISEDDVVNGKGYVLFYQLQQKKKK